MIDSSTESVLGTWSAPECPYIIEYSPRVLDDIRLAVVDAFYSLPRGGAEIGGILLGRYADGRISILDYRALDCEHAMGPSFTLSQNDQTQLADLLAAAQQDPDGMRPVGWYHSHTRSEIFLSEADQDIHKRFFPAPGPRPRPRRAERVCYPKELRSRHAHSKTKIVNAWPDASLSACSPRDDGGGYPPPYGGLPQGVPVHARGPQRGDGHGARCPDICRLGHRGDGCGRIEPVLARR